MPTLRCSLPGGALLLGLVLGIGSASAQTGFQMRYGGASNDVFYSVEQTADSGYIVAGYSEGDVYLVRTDSEGDTLWTKRYGGPSSDVGVGVRRTPDGGYIVAGHTASFGAGASDMYLIKTDSAGDTLWTRTYGGASADFGLSVEVTSDSGYIVAGYTQSFGAGFSDVYLVRTDSLGDTLWTRTYGGSFNDFGRSVGLTMDGGFIIAGETISLLSPSYQMYLVRTDSLGDTLWTRKYGGSGDEYGFSVRQTSDTGYILAGYTESVGAGGADVYLVKTNPAGNTLWTRTYGDTLDDKGTSVVQASDGGYVVAGYTNSFGAGLDDVYLVRTDAQGDSLWTRTYGGAFDDAGFFVRETFDGGYVVAGSTLSFGAVNLDGYLVKGDENGFITGVEDDVPEGIPLTFRLEQNYPNPFNPSATIRFSVAGSDFVSLRVYNMLGQEITTLVSDELAPGRYSVEWDGSGFASGVYFYRLQAGEFVETRRLLLVR